MARDERDRIPPWFRATPPFGAVYAPFPEEPPVVMASGRRMRVSDLWMGVGRQLIVDVDTVHHARILRALGFDHELYRRNRSVMGWQVRLHPPHWLARVEAAFAVAVALYEQDERESKAQQQ